MSYVYKHLVHFMGSESLPVRACRSMILNEQVAGFLGKCLPEVIKGRTIPAARFQTVLGSHYECLNDPVDFVNTARKLKFPILPIFGYELSWGFSCVAAAAVVYMGTDAQKVIDTVYEACSLTLPYSRTRLIDRGYANQTSGLLSLIPQAKGTCVKFLRNICGLHDLPPTAMQIDMLSPTGLPASGGGFANVFRCMYQNADVAVKTLKVYANSSIPIISRVSDPRACVNSTVCVSADCVRIEVLQGSDYLEQPSPPQHIAATWSVERQGAESVCNGFRLDAKRDHQRLRKRSF